LKIPIYILLYLVTFSFNANGQWLNSLYGNINFGYKKHYESGLVFHGFKYFSCAAYMGNTSIATGPIYYPSHRLFSGERLKNTYTTGSVFLGLKTRTSTILDLSVMIGLSDVKYYEYYNIESHQGYSQGITTVTYDVKKGHVTGTVIRGDAILTLGKGIGLNIAYQYNFNSIRNDFNILIGLNIGLVKDRTYD